MPDRPTCKDCRFWDSGERFGDCRRRAPVAQDNGWGGWPATNATDWCGEHEPHGSDADIKARVIRNLGKVT